MTPSELSFSYIIFMACMAASAPPFSPADTCKGPAASVICSLRHHEMDFPTMRLITSPTPIGLICTSSSPGFLFRGINRPATYASREYGSRTSVAILRAKIANSSRSSLPSFLNLLLHSMRLHW